MKNFEIYNEEATKVLAVVSEKKAESFNVDLEDPFSAFELSEKRPFKTSFKMSKDGITAKFDIYIEFNTNGHVSYFEIKRDNGIISKGRNKLQSDKFVALCSKLGIEIDLYFDSFEDLKKGLA